MTPGGEGRAGIAGDPDMLPTLSALEASDFGQREHRAVREILGTILRPHFELSVVGGQGIKVPLPLFGWCRIPA